MLDHLPGEVQVCQLLVRGLFGRHALAGFDRDDVQVLLLYQQAAVYRYQLHLLSGSCSCRSTTISCSCCKTAGSSRNLVAGNLGICSSVSGYCRHVDFEKTKVFLGAEECQGIGGEGRRHDDFQEDGFEEFGHGEVHLAVEGHDTAEDGGLVALVGLGPGFYHILARTGAAGVHVLEAHAEGLGELADNVQGRISILYVIIRQLFTV